MGRSLFEDVFGDLLCTPAFNKVFSEFKSVNDLTEEELKAALEQKVKEKEKKLTRKEQLKAKVEGLFKEGVEYTVDDDSTRDCAMLKITKPFRANCVVYLKDEKFFT